MASKLSHPNILKVLHVFRYQETEKIENNRSLKNETVIVMDKHEKNIGELTTEERKYLPDLLQVLVDALIYITSKDLVHGDIKPANILISKRDGSLRAFVGDFGLTGKSGGTSIFMAPEGLDESFRVVGKTDLYSFAITVLFLMFSEDLVLELLFLPISEYLEIFRRSLFLFQLLDLIFKSLRCDPTKRVSLRSWRNFLKNMKNLDGNMLIKKISPQNLKTKGIILKPLIKARRNESGFVMDCNEVNKNAWKMSTAISHVQKLSSIYCDPKFSLLSKDIHDQGSELVCWAYAISTMLRASLKSAIKKFNIQNGLEILENENHHKMMRKELCMNIFPFGDDGADLRLVINLLTKPSCLLDAGLNRLRTVTSILKNFDFEPQLYVNPKFARYNDDAPFYCGTFEDAFNSGKVLASNPDGFHSAALFSSKSQNYIFKDSTKRKIREGSISDSDYEQMFNGWWIEFKNVS